MEWQVFGTFKDIRHQYLPWLYAIIPLGLDAAFVLRLRYK